MDNGRPNERALWSSRLEEPGALPGVGLTDKEATWDKLYERLRETPRRRTLPWLWTAAACLLLALIPAALLLKEKKVTPRSPQKVAVQPRTNRLQTPSPDPAPSVVIKNTLPITAATSVTPPHLARRESPAHIRSLAQPLVSKTQDQPGLSIPPSPGHLLPTVPGQAQTPIIVSALPAPKKQPRVIHINDLDPPPSAPGGIATGPRQRPGRLQIGINQEREIFRPATTYQTYYPIVSFKPSQNP